MGVVIIVDVFKVVIAKVCGEVSKSSLMSIKQNTSPSRVSGPPICYPSSSWLALVTKYLVVHVVVDLDIVAIYSSISRCLDQCC